MTVRRYTDAELDMMLHDVIGALQNLYAGVVLLRSRTRFATADDNSDIDEAIGYAAQSIRRVSYVRDLGLDGVDSQDIPESEK